MKYQSRVKVSKNSKEYETMRLLPSFYYKWTDVTLKRTLLNLFLNESGS